jgi:hypothetical protein
MSMRRLFAIIVSAYESAASTPTQSDGDLAVELMMSIL